MKNLIAIPFLLLTLTALAVEPPETPPPTSDEKVIGTIQETTPETKKIVSKIMQRKKKLKDSENKILKSSNPQLEQTK